MVIDRPRHLFSVDDYHRMTAAGILSEHDRVELIEGEIIEMSPIGDAHLSAVNRFNHQLSRRLAPDLLVSVQNPLRLGPHNEPQPDLAVFRPAGAGLAVPTPQNTLLVIEVADSSLNHDRTVKAILYAQAGIPEMWLADLVNERLERHTEPSPAGYRLIAVAHRGETLPSTVLPDLSFSLDDLLR